LYYHQDSLCTSIQQLFQDLILLLSTTTFVIFQKISHVNQKDAQWPSVLQLIRCHMKFYICNAIYFILYAYNHHWKLIHHKGSYSIDNKNLHQIDDDLLWQKLKHMWSTLLTFSSQMNPTFNGIPTRILLIFRCLHKL
jgi:hypothetical protein